jgi:hypothetical protein
MPSFGVGAADQYLATVDTVASMALFRSHDLRIRWAVSTSVDLAHAEFDLRVQYSIPL